MADKAGTQAGATVLVGTVVAFFALVCCCGLTNPPPKAPDPDDARRHAEEMEAAAAAREVAATDAAKSAFDAGDMTGVVNALQAYRSDQMTPDAALLWHHASAMLALEGAQRAWTKDKDAGTSYVNLHTYDVHKAELTAEWLAAHDPSSKDAEALRGQVEKRGKAALAKAEKEAAKAKAEAECQGGMTAREVFANLFERGALKKGMDLEASVRGKCGEELVIEYIFCGRPMVYQFQEAGEAKKLGFTKIRCNDGYGGGAWADL